MPTLDPLLHGLSDADLRQVESWLIDFDQHWRPGLLSVRVHELPREGTLRAAALAEMVKIDLERQWQLGEAKPIEDYLARFPELGTVESASAELIFAEYRARHGTSSPGKLADLTCRFPRQADALLALIEAHPSSAANAPSHPPTVAERAPSTADLTHATALPAPSTSPNAGPAAITDATRLPEQFGRYRILKRLGHGGMGAVYLAHDSQLDRQVALKVPFLSGPNPALLERFYREGRAAATLHHPNVCPVYDVGETQGVHFLSMAYLEGEPLSTVLRQRGPLPQPEAAQIVRKLALALAVAHGKGVIHRDLKPANVMIVPGGEPVVMDFGLARRSGVEEAKLTGDGSVLGTPAYMPPEQMQGDVAAMGPGCDIYSLGVILYELVTGVLPYRGPTAYEVIAQALSETPKRPSLLRHDLSPGLEGIIMKAMAKNVSERFGSMGAFAAALDDWLARQVAPQVPAETERLSMARAEQGGPRKPTMKWLAAGLFGAVVLLLAGITIIIRDKDGKEKKIEVEAGSTLTVTDGDKPLLQVTQPRADPPAKPMPVAEIVPVPGDPEMAILKGHTGPVWALAYRPDGTLISLGKDGRIKLWDVTRNKEIATLKHSDGSIDFWGMALSPDGRLLVTFDNWDTRTVKIWDLAKREVTQTVEMTTQAAAFSPDGKLLALAGEGVRVLDMANRDLLCKIDGHAGDVATIDFSPDGSVLATGSTDKNVKLWNPRTGARLATLQGHTYHVTFVGFSRDGKQLLSATAIEGDAKVWDVRTGKETSTFKSGPYQGRQRDLWSFSDVWDRNTWAVSKEFPPGVGLVAISPDRVHAAARDGASIRLWDRKARVFRAKLSEHTDGITGMEFSADGKVLASSSLDGTIRLWDVAKALSQDLDLKE